MNPKMQDPQALKHHFSPLLKRIPLRAAPEQETLRASIIQTGAIPEPILLDAAGQVATEQGRALVLAACELGLTQIQTVPTDLDAETLLLDELTQRRLYTASAIAYLAYPLLKPSFEKARQRQIDCQKKGPKPQCSPVVSYDTTENLTIADFAREKGIGRVRLFEAQKVHDLFATHAERTFSFTQVGGAEDGAVVECTLREWFEPKLLRAPQGGEHDDAGHKPISLGAVLKAVGYLLSENNFTGKARPGQDPEQLDFWFKPISTLRDDCFGNWDKLTKPKRAVAQKLWETMLLKLPEDLVEVTLETIEKRRCKL